MVKLKPDISKKTFNCASHTVKCIPTIETQLGAVEILDGAAFYCDCHEMSMHLVFMLMHIFFSLFFHKSHNNMTILLLFSIPRDLHLSLELDIIINVV